MDKCPVCGSKIGKDAEACGVCGTVFDAIPPKCPLCGTEVNEFVTQCPNCGAEMEGNHETIHDSAIDEVEIAEMPSEADNETARLIATDVFVDVELEELVKLSGVGPLKAKILYDAGFTDLRKLKLASVVELMNIRGIGRKAAGEIKTALRESSLEEIQEIEITRETVEAEYQCPLCETIVSAYETSCYECGCIFEPGSVADEDSDRLALSYYDSKLLRDPENKELWYARGATLTKMEEYDPALNSFDRALELDRTFQNAWMSKADIYNKLGDSSKAAECYSHIISTASAGLGIGSEDDGSEDGAENEAPSPQTPDQEESGPEAAAPEPELPEEEVSEIVEQAEEPRINDVPEEVPEIGGQADEPLIDDVPEEVPEIVEQADEPQTEDVPVEEEAAEQISREPALAEVEPVEVQPEEVPEIEEQAVEPDQKIEVPLVSRDALEPQEPEMVSPQSFNDISSSSLEIEMDYTRPEPERPDLENMSDAEMKKYLSKRASHVKPYLSLAKELNVNINQAKKLIAKAVAESKKGDLKLAIEIINKGIEYAENEFHEKVSGDIKNMADVIRNLKMTGIDVSTAVEQLTESKNLMGQGNIIDAVAKLRQCLETVESIAA